MSDLKAQLEQTLRHLVAIDSTSTRSNLPVIDFLHARLEPLGFRLTRMAYRDEAGVEKVNLLATRGAEEIWPLVLVGHTDCVPFDPAWAEALTLTARDGKLYGRGSADTKAFVACAVTAAARVPQGPLALLFTADEELGCIGAKRLADAKLFRARYAIVGEPTSLTPMRAHKGYCLAEVEVKGKEGHSAYPSVGESAIFRAGRFLQQLEQLALGELRVETDALFDPPFTTVNVGLISGGKAKNIIPGSCRFTVEWRPLPKQPVDQGEKLLHKVAAQMRAADPGFEAEIRFLRADRGLDTRAESEVVQFLVEASKNAPATIPFGTEGPQLTALGAEAVVFGPGDIKVAHRTGEFVPVDELVRCEEILEQAIRRFCPG